MNLNVKNCFIYLAQQLNMLPGWKFVVLMILILIYY